MVSVSLRTKPVMSGAMCSFPLESRAPSRYIEKTSAPTPRTSMAFAQHIGTTRYVFPDLKTLLAAAA
ncbi:MAG: hypothetical protein ACK5UK_01300 [bacterium]